jgi:hypothetical protein
MRRFSLTLMVLLLCHAGKVMGQASVEAAQSMFIYNFTRLIEWPNKDGDFTIGVLGSGSLVSELSKTTAGKTVGQQKIVVKKIKDISEINKLNILFISSGNSGKMADILAKVGSSHTLIITEKRGMIDAGAAINFILNDDRLKFELKTANASRHGLRVLSKLESMAILK